MVPLKKLLELFTGPKNLIKKRTDKRLDVDSLSESLNKFPETTQVLIYQFLSNTIIIAYFHLQC